MKTNNTKRHPELPFKISGTGWLVGSDGVLVCRILDDTASAKDKAKAEFILRACNGHYQLLAALENALAVIDRLGEDNMIGNDMTEEKQLVDKLKRKNAEGEK